MDRAGVSTLQEVILTGGRLWHGWDAAGHVFAFQERRPPDPGPAKWTTRLPKDGLVRRPWDGSA